MEIITRAEAKAQGLTHYFTGKPCKYGHVSPRRTSGCCMECDKEKKAFIRAADPEAHRAKQRARYQADPERFATERRQHRQENPEAARATAKRSYERNLEKVKARQADWHARNRAEQLVKMSEYSKQKRLNDPEWVAKRRVKAAAYLRKRRQEDPVFNLANRLRVRLANCLNGNGASKAATTMELVGCSREFLMAHIESQFTRGMTWENRSEWEIDHIRPCASFDMTDPEQQRIAFHWSNLRPLWRKDNRAKSDKHPELVQPGLLLTMT